VNKIFLLATVLMFSASSAWAGNVCTCGPSTGVGCASTSSTECGNDALNAACCKSDDWDSNTDSNAERSFIATEDTSIYCGDGTTTGNICIADTGENACVVSGAGVGGDAGKCTITNEPCAFCDDHVECDSPTGGDGVCSCTGGDCEGHCTEPEEMNLGECKHCTNDIAAPCTSNANCDSRGKMVIVNQAVEYCGHDNLRYVIQPTKFVSFTDADVTQDKSGATASYLVSSEDCNQQVVSKSLQRVPLDALVPSETSLENDTYFEIEPTGASCASASECLQGDTCSGTCQHIGAIRVTRAGVYKIILGVRVESLSKSKENSWQATVYKAASGASSGASLGSLEIGAVIERHEGNTSGHAQSVEELAVNDTLWVMVGKQKHQDAKCNRNLTGKDNGVNFYVEWMGDSVYD